MGGSVWFRRYVKELRKMSSHIKFVPITHGYYRVYFVNGGESAYIHEVWKWMPYHGYEIEEKDMNLVSQKYFEEYEDQLTLNRKIKNFVEGFAETLETTKTRLYMLKNNKEFRNEATKAYKQVVIK